MFSQCHSQCQQEKRAASGRAPAIVEDLAALLRAQMMDIIAKMAMDSLSETSGLHTYW